jgi:peptide chain release factor 1
MDATMTDVSNNPPFAPLEPAIRVKLDEMLKRYHELHELMATPDVATNPGRFRALSKEYGALAKTVEHYQKLRQLQEEKESARQMLDGETDEEMQDLAREEFRELEEQEAALTEEVRGRFVLDDEDASRDVIVEVRAGTGGDEAALFAADLFGMYRRFAERRGWKIELMNASPTELGGFREITFGISGEDVYRQLRYESGGHRVQRVPETETQGRIHTSACTVAVMPEAEDVDLVIKDEDLLVDRYHSSGPGGQNVNKTSSAIRIHHKPTGLIVQCQDERSQQKNLIKAMRMLRTRLYDADIAKKHAERSAWRKSLIGSGDRSERIRTYNFPQNRLTDHRINLTLHKLDRIIMGELDDVIDALLAHDRKMRLEALASGKS